MREIGIQVLNELFNYVCNEQRILKDWEVYKKIIQNVVIIIEELLS